jgi:hypothetical protein
MSRPRSSTRSSATPARGGRPAGRPGVYVATPQSDIYVTLLGVALGSMLLSILLLVLRLSQYEFKITPS